MNLAQTHPVLFVQLSEYRINEFMPIRCKEQEF